MKRLLYFPLVLALCTMPSFSQHTKAKLVVAPNATTPTGIDFNWAYSPNVPACSGTNANCYSGFTLTRTDVTPNVVLATPTTLGPTALSYTYAPGGNLPYANYAFSLVANGYNSSGGALTSAADTVTVIYGVTTLNGPTNLTGVPQ
jgi:hypothetical protein